MSDVNETLADWRKTMYAYDKLGVHAGGALLSAVEKVLALHTPTRVTWSSDPKYQVCTACNNMWPCGTVKAITDALGATK